MFNSTVEQDLATTSKAPQEAPRASSQLEDQLDRAVASGNLNWIAYVTKRLAEVQVQAQVQAQVRAPRKSTLDLDAARREVAMYEQNMAEPPVTYSYLTLAKPENEPPKEDRQPKYVTERPYLEKNKRYRPFSLR